MKTVCFILSILLHFTASAQDPAGKWKKISHVTSFDGKTFDSHKALLQSKPCAAGIVWEINADKTLRLNATASGCDEKYKEVQQKLYAKTKWKVENGILSTSSTNFAVSQSYKLSFNGNKMVWEGINGQGTITYQKF